MGAYTLQQVAGVITRAKAQGATHLLIVCDTWDYEDFPVMANSLEEAKAIKDDFHIKHGYKVMETYDLAVTDIATLDSRERRMDF